MHTKVTLLSLFSLPNNSIHPQTKEELVVVFASAAKVALPSEQMCILLLIRILVRSSARLRVVITSAENTVDRLPIRILLLCLLAFYNPFAGFSLLIFEVSRSHTMTRHSR